MIPSYSAFSFPSRQAHLSALYDSCMMIVNTYEQCSIMDNVEIVISEEIKMSGYDFAQYAKEIMNRIAEQTL